MLFIRTGQNNVQIFGKATNGNLFKKKEMVKISELIWKCQVALTKIDTRTRSRQDRYPHSISARSTPALDLGKTDTFSDKFTDIHYFVVCCFVKGMYNYARKLHMAFFCPDLIKPLFVTYGVSVRGLTWLLGESCVHLEMTFAAYPLLLQTNRQLSSIHPWTTDFTTFRKDWNRQWNPIPLPSPPLRQSALGHLKSTLTDTKWVN